MRLNRSANTFVITASMLVTWSGCAYMNSTGLDDIIPAAPTQQFSDDRQLLSDLKIDPMASSQLADQFTRNQIDDAQTVYPQLDHSIEQASAEMPVPLDQAQQVPVSPPVANQSDEFAQIHDAVPVQDPNDVAPIILKAVNRGPQQIEELPMPQPPNHQIVVEDLPMIPLENNDVLPVLQATVENDFNQTATAVTETVSPQHSNIVTDPQFAEPLLPTPQQENRLLPVPINEAPEARPRELIEADQQVDEVSMQATPAMPAQDALPDFESDFDEFISEQMQFLVPPCAEHAGDVECESECCEEKIEDIALVDDPGTRAETPDFEPEETDSRFDNDFVVEARPTNINENEALDAEDNYFSGSRIPAETKNPDGAEIATISAEMPGAAWPKTDPNTAPAAAKATPTQPESEKLSWQNQLDQTIEAFEEEIASVQDDLEAENLESGLAMLKALRQRMRPVEDSPEEVRNYWTHQIEAITNLLNQPAGTNDSRIAALALEELRLAVHQLQVVADLKVFNAVVCKSVSGYGQFTPFATNEFVPRQTILVYCEIDNFAPLLKTVDSVTSYRTRLSSSFTIRDANGTVVQHQDFPVVTDNARNLRRDFFMHLPVTLAELEPGSYELQVSVRDHGSDKSSELDRGLKLTIR